MAEHGSVLVTPGPCHGDWAWWNMARDGDVVLLWDWEHFSETAVQGFDHLHFLALEQRRIAGSRESEDVWVGRARSALATSWGCSAEVSQKDRRILTLGAEGPEHSRTMIRLGFEGVSPQTVDDQGGRLMFAEDLAAERPAGPPITHGAASARCDEAVAGPQRRRTAWEVRPVGVTSLIRETRVTLRVVRATTREPETCVKAILLRPSRTVCVS